MAMEGNQARLEGLVPRQYQEEVFSRAQKGNPVLNASIDASDLTFSWRQHHRSTRYRIGQDAHQLAPNQMDRIAREIQRKDNHLPGPQSHSS